MISHTFILLYGQELFLLSPTEEGLRPKRLGLLIFFPELFISFIEISLDYSHKRHEANKILLFYRLCFICNFHQR